MWLQLCHLCTHMCTVLHTRRVRVRVLDECATSHSTMCAAAFASFLQTTETHAGYMLCHHAGSNGCTYKTDEGPAGHESHPGCHVQGTALTTFTPSPTIRSLMCSIDKTFGRQCRQACHGTNKPGAQVNSCLTTAVYNVMSACAFFKRLEAQIPIEE